MHTKLGFLIDLKRLCFFLPCSILETVHQLNLSKSHLKHSFSEKLSPTEESTFEHTVELKCYTNDDSSSRPVATVEAEEALASSLLSLPQMPPRFSNVPPRFSHQKKLLILGCIEETEFILVVHIEVCLLLPSA